MAKNTIKLKDYLHVVEEYNAASAITPGELIEVTSGGKVQAHSTENGEALPVMFATEDEFQGNEISDDYDSDAPVNCWIPQRGDMVYALLSAGEDVAIGDALTSDGSGNLQAYVASDADVGAIVAVAAEAVDNSGTSGTARIIVRVV